MPGSRSVVLAPKWLGDVVMALPALAAISENRPQGVDIVAPESIERLLRATRLFRLVLPATGSVFADRRLLKVAQYDESFSLPNSFRSAWVPLVSGIPVRRGYRTDWRAVCLNHGLPAPARDRHQVFDYDPLLADLGFGRETDVPRVALAPGFLRAGREALVAAGVDPDVPFIGLNPGGIGNPAKRWPTERFAEIGAALRRQGIPVVVYCGATDLEDARRIASAADPNLPIVGAAEDVLGLAAALAPCRLLVTNDSGGMHLAAAVGVRCLALFGPTNPDRTSPCGPGHRIVRRTAMAEIPGEEVLAAAREMFGNSTDPG